MQRARITGGVGAEFSKHIQAFAGHVQGTTNTTKGLLRITLAVTIDRRQ